MNIARKYMTSDLITNFLVEKISDNGAGINIRKKIKEEEYHLGWCCGYNVPFKGFRGRIVVDIPKRQVI